MMLKKILVSLSGTADDDVTLATAFAVASPHTHVEALFVRPDPRDSVPMLGEALSGAMVEEILRAARTEGETRAASARARFDTAMAQAGAVAADVPPGPGRLSARFIDPIGRGDDILSAAARLSDLVIFGRKALDADAAHMVAFEAALISGGRPILLAGHEVPKSIGRCIAVAWNGSGEGARAVSAAMPLLSRAERVLILTAETGVTSGDAADGLADYFAWHLLPATVMRFKPAGPVGASVMAEAMESGADMLVMGGYGHSRVREMIFGGVTRWVLEHAGLPVLMAH